jgi:hypothetical protein
MIAGAASRAIEALSTAPRLALDALRGERRHLYAGLGFAILLHAALLAGVIMRMPGEEERRRIGERSGAVDGIAVLLVDEADFKSRNTVPFDGARPPANAAAEQARQQQAKPEPALQQPRQETAAERAAEAQKQRAASLAKEMPELLALPEPGHPPPKAAESKPQPEQRQPQPQHKHQQKQTASLNPSPKTSQDDLVFDGSASFSRPAGITRSGENDDFGRGVIRALRQTMPPPRGSRGRVTIRFLLSETGSLVEVRLVATTADLGLTQSVVFASKQSSFPIPPKGATIADRTFLVTYIYD